MIVPVPEWLIPKHFTPIYLYELLDPRDNTRKYIGKTNNLKKRYSNHLSDCHLRSRTKKNSWIKSLKNKNLAPIMRVISITTNYWIDEAEIITIGSSQNLLNMTGGGDGQCLMTEEVRQKIKDALKNIKRKPHTAETRLKIAKTQTGVPKPSWTFRRYLQQSTPLVATNISTGRKIYFLNASRAARRLGAHKSHILKCCHRTPRYKSCKGFSFSFLKDK